jgi:hypothetical protein
MTPITIPRLSKLPPKFIGPLTESEFAHTTLQGQPYKFVRSSGEIVYYIDPAKVEERSVSETA